MDAIQGLRSPALDRLMTAVSGLGNLGLLWIALTLLLLILPRFRRLGAGAAMALIINALLCNVILKPLFDRIRPFEANGLVQLLIEAPGDPSFPSGHTSAAFTFFFVLWFSGVRRLALPVLAAASLMAFSRLYLYVHYPTDIAGGILVGLAAGYTAARGLKKLKTFFAKPVDICRNIWYYNTRR